MKKIFIVGGGFTGVQLAKMLALEGKHVVLIDNNAERVRSASDQIDCTVIAANGNDLEVLENAGISNADALIALTADDETNMICCSLVDAVYPEILKIARVRNFAYYNSVDLTRRRLRNLPGAGRPLYGIDFMLNPDVEAAAAIGRAVEHGAVGSVIDLKNGHALTTLTIGEGSPLINMPLWQLTSLPGWHYLVAYVESEGQASLPNGNTVLKAGDWLGIVSKSTEIGDLVKFTLTSHEVFRRILVFGADRVGTLLLERLEERARQSIWERIFGGQTPRLWNELVVVDQNAERCRAAAERFPRARVICGDITDEALMAEEDLCACDLMVAASGNYELNLVMASYMKSRGVGKCIALTANSAYRDVARKLGIDVTIPLRGAVVDGILGHLRGDHVAAIHTVCSRKFEIVEGDISPKSEVVDKMLGEIDDLSSDCVVLLAGVNGNATLEVPHGTTVLQAGMHVVLIARSGNTWLLNRFFGNE